ncbi:hypothetical protein CBOM_07932 [Ceraceosorus bombacis]|uniref:Uncharacterized protein n=1 Tax=Ceraceosorus bombacis TaxID=401625 RepID=A0A0P1BA99_9BASI|nr:hypothetical protein CBOM_07932 [Ceraceosorus bombacis]
MPGAASPSTRSADVVGVIQDLACGQPSRGSGQNKLHHHGAGHAMSAEVGFVSASHYSTPICTKHAPRAAKQNTVTPIGHGRCLRTEHAARVINSKSEDYRRAASPGLE